MERMNQLVFAKLNVLSHILSRVMTTLAFSDVWLAVPVRSLFVMMEVI